MSRIRFRTSGALVALAWALALPVFPLAGQEPPTLDRVDELTRLGRTEEARTVLLEWWGSVGGQATRRDVQRALWMRGTLTVDPAQADLDFRRLVIEYPGGPFSDMALFRLAQAAYARGDSVEAARQVARLTLEYPGSSVRRDAEAWLANAGPVPQALPGTEPGAEDAAAAADAPAPPEPEQPAAEAAPAEAPSQALPPPATAESTGSFAVQLGAFSSRDRAEAHRRRIEAAGFDARLVMVPGSSLVRVRVGRFDSAAGADAILKRLQDLGFTAALARDAHLEERVVR